MAEEKRKGTLYRFRWWGAKATKKLL